MKNLLVLAMLAMLFIACSQSDQPLEPTESTEPTQDETHTTALAPDPPENTAILQLVSNKTLFNNQFTKEHNFILPSENSEMITPVDKLTDVYVISRGQVQKQERIFKREIYQFLWCYLDDEIVLVNIFDNQIRPVSEDDVWDHIDANKDEYKRLYDEYFEKHIAGKEFVPPELFSGVETLTYAAMSKQPFFHSETLEYPGDQIEVVIKHRFTYNYKTHPASDPEEREMLFVDVKRNITRPHITFPQPLLPE